MARKPEPLQRIFDSDARLATWKARHEREEGLNRLIRRDLPRPLADRVRATGTEDGALQLSVEAGALAGILRQKTPELLSMLQREGWKFNAIRVRVQVRVPPKVERKPALDQPDRLALRPLAGLARTLPAGPLKASLARLLRRIG